MGLEIWFYSFNEEQVAFTGFPGGSVVKNLPANAGDAGPVPGSGRPPGGGNGNPLQYSCLIISMDRGAWRAAVHGGHKESDTIEHTHIHTLPVAF